MEKAVPQNLFFPFIIVVFLLIPPSFAKTGAEFIEVTEFGRINWSRFTIESTGVGTLTDKREKGTPQLTLEAAKAAAQKGIFQTLGCLRITCDQTLSDILEQQGNVAKEIRKIIQDARVVTQEYLSDGTAKVVMELSLLGAFSQLILPHDVKQIELVKPIGPPQNTPPPFTGLIVDATGIGARPALVPKILDENRKEVFGATFASRDSAVQQGMCRYVPSLDAARRQDRVGDRPLVVKGLKTEDGRKTTIIISTADAAKLKRASGHLQLLRQCAVVIAIDPGSLRRSHES